MITEETVRLRSQKCRASAYQSWKRDPSMVNGKNSVTILKRREIIPLTLSSRWRLWLVRDPLLMS